MTSLKKRFPLYSRLIKLYPKQYQKEYGEQILQTTADMLDGAPNPSQKLAIWTRLAIDLPINITKQQVQSGGIYSKNTPAYVKASNLLSGLLLLPFFLALAANGLDKLINNHNLYNTWLWRTPVLGLWVLFFPMIALILAAGSYLINLTRYKNTPWLNRLLDIRHAWPMLLPAAIALGILFIIVFHDSFQCWVQTPGYLASHLHQAWQCTVNNRAL